MIWHGKKGIAFRIEKLSCGYPWTNISGTYLNSPRRWMECGVIVAKDREEAATRAMFAVGSSLVRVTEQKNPSEDDKGYL